MSKWIQIYSGFYDKEWTHYSNIKGNVVSKISISNDIGVEHIRWIFYRNQNFDAFNGLYNGFENVTVRESMVL